MKMPKLKKYVLYEITWQDTHIPTQPGWMSEKEHAEWVKNAGSLVKSSGYYISQDKDFIHLIGDCDSDNCEGAYFLRPINIAIHCIRKIRNVKNG